MAEGDTIDEFNGVYVYYNGGVNQSQGRNLSTEGYNIGIKYQCVEFVKRYYLEKFNLKMPDAMGHAKHFYNPKVPSGSINEKRGLIQYSNGSKDIPQVNDLIVFSPTITNPYGHVAIVSMVTSNTLQVVQQNAGPFSSSRATYALKNIDGKWYVQGKSTLGWLRMPPENISSNK